MDRPVIAALADLLSRHVDLSKSRRETVALAMVGMIGARTVNLAHVASERGSATVELASTYRRLQRLFQHARPPEDWAAPAIAQLAGGAEKRTLVMDRTNWKLGGSEQNILVLAIRTRHSQVPLMWTVLGRPGNSSSEERIALMARYLALFGAASIGMLLADREFAGSGWFNWLNDNAIPFTIRLAHNRLITRADGCEVKLSSQITLPRKGRHCTGTLEGTGHPLHISARMPKGGEWVIGATNRPGHDALKTYRKRWAIGPARPPARTRGACGLAANCKTRGLNLEDTRLTAPAKLHLLTTLIALAVAWSVRAARTLLGNTAPPRKTHGYHAQSYFRAGFTFRRIRLRAEHPDALIKWRNLRNGSRNAGVE